MRIAYLIVVHSNPRLLRRLLRVLSSDGSGFFIHVDKKADILDFGGVSGPNVVVSKERLPVYWGEFSQVQATLRLIEQAIAAPETYEYLVLLQGSDYPLRSSAYIRRFMEANRGQEFISMVKMPAPGYPMSKIDKVRYPSDKPLLRLLSRALGKVGLATRDSRNYLGSLVPYSGDACWALSRAACQYILEFVKDNPQFERYFRNTFTSDEVFFHTILGNSPFSCRTRRSLLYRDWSIPGDHPAMINKTHIRFFQEHDRICLNDQFGFGEVLFARKFSDGQLDLVADMDAMIERKEKTDQAFSPKASL